MAFAFRVAEASVHATPVAINTTGADLLVAFAAHGVTGSPSFTDSKGNTWTLGGTAGPSGYECVLWYCLAPIVGSGHTFECPVSGDSAYCVAAFSGALTSEPRDQASAGGGTSSPVSTGSVTPSEDNELVIAGISDSGAANGFTPDTGFTLAASHNAGSGFGVALSYQIQTTATARNHAWTYSNSTGNGAALIATFKAVGGGGGGPPPGTGRRRIRPFSFGM